MTLLRERTNEEPASYLDWGDRCIIRSKAQPYSYLTISPVWGFKRWTGELKDATVISVNPFSGDWRSTMRWLDRGPRAYARGVKVKMLREHGPYFEVIEP